MAYGPKINTQFDGQRKLIYVFNIDGAMDGSAGTTIIDVSALAFLSLIGYNDSDYSCIGGIVNPNTGGNANGDVNIVIPAHTAGDTYSIVFEFIKYYE